MSHTEHALDMKLLNVPFVVVPLGQAVQPAALAGTPKKPAVQISHWLAKVLPAAIEVVPEGQRTQPLESTPGRVGDP